MIVKTDGVVKQLFLVPKAYVNTVLELAHTHLLGAHLGVAKTKKMIINRFTGHKLYRQWKIVVNHVLNVKGLSPGSTTYN